MAPNNYNQPPRDLDSDLDKDDDALFAALENEDDSAYRANRIEQLNAELASAQKSRPSGASNTNSLQESQYPTITTDQTLLDFTTQTNRCVIHFAHPDFTRCITMDERLRALAGEHYNVRFARVDVRSTPFVVEKLKIRVLPCVIGFKDGIAVERIIGFEGLASGGNDGDNAFSTATLEKRLLWKGVLSEAKFKTGDGESEASEEDSDEDRRWKSRGTIRSGNALKRTDDDDDDWD